MKLLIIESTEKGSSDLRETLVTLGYDCEFALAGPEVRLVCESCHPDVLVLEWNGEKHQEELLAAQLNPLSRPQIVVWMNNPDVAQVIRLVNEFQVCAFFGHRPELRELMIIAERVENQHRQDHERKDQHSRLALEYSRLKQAYDELRGTS